MNKVLSQVIKNYKSRLQEEGLGNELYKWMLLQQYKGKPDLDAPDLQSELKSINYDNLIFHSGLTMIDFLAEHRSDAYRESLKRLFNDKEDINERVVRFDKEILQLYRDIEPDTKNTHQHDERTIATLLTYYDPEKYAFFKDSFYQKFCAILNTPAAGKGAKYGHYLSLLEDFISTYIQPDSDLLDTIQALLPVDAYPDPTHKLLAQDILYTMLDKNMQKVNINHASVYKVSMGDFNDHEIAECIQQGKILVHRFTKAMGRSKVLQGETFTDEMRVGDYFYLTPGNRVGFKLLGRITGDAVSATYKNYGSEDWVERPFEMVAEAISAEKYTRQNKRWTPIHNSTCIRIKPNELNDANRLMFEPAFLLKLISENGEQKEEPNNTEIKMNTPNPMNLDLNLILFGPPGTGKTYTLNQVYRKYFEYATEGLSEVEFIKRVRQFTWWEVVAAALSAAKVATVRELANSRLVRAKHQPSENYPMASHIISSVLRQKTDVFEQDEGRNKWKLKSDFVNQDHPGIQKLNALLLGRGLNVITVEKHHDFVTFHQNFAYEDFIEGIKPVMDIGSTPENKDDLAYDIKKGVFYQSCLRALELMGYNSMEECYQDTQEERAKKAEEAKRKGYNQALFIDEINRANVSAVFGELITLIEHDKRIGAEHEIWVTLPYSKTPFAVPPNLYIIGTMNTADRSVEALDTALRRRFSFIEMPPQYNLLSPAYQYWKLLWDYKDVDWDTTEFKDKEDIMLDFFGASDKLLGERKNIWDRMRKEGMLSQQVGYLNENEFTGVNLKDLLQKINHRIEYLLGKDNLIGHSYFLDVKSLRSLRAAFQNKVIPLLQEYFYGDYGKIGLVLGEGFFESTVHNGNIFANFEDYEASALEEKKVYHLRNVLNEEAVPDQAFLYALKEMTA